MRLIDVESGALPEKKLFDCGAMDIDTFIYKKDIDAAPTIDPESLRPQGEWQSTDAYPHWVYCSVCHKVYVRNKSLISLCNLPTNYCPNCGAKMKNKEGMWNE